MSEYGLTDSGPNIKRLDVILDELHTGLSTKWGVNTRQTADSFINHLLTNFADKIAELWEFGEEVYYSLFPSTAEGLYLDNVAQYCGTVREEAAPSYYDVLCMGNDGTRLPQGQIIKTSSYPITRLESVADATISRDNFAIASISILHLAASGAYAVGIDDNDIQIGFWGDKTKLEVMELIKLGLESDENITETFSIELNEQTAVLTITANTIPSNHVLTLSNNLTADSIGTVVRFATVETGDINLPEGVIDTIESHVTGWDSVTNVGEYIPGRDEETDVEFRKSYVDKIFNHSSSMLASIKSAILNNVPSVSRVTCFENASDFTDAHGLPPHSVEIVVYGGTDEENAIAQQILDTKAAGINTYGAVECTLVGEEGEDVIIRFSRPDEIDVWLDIKVTTISSDGVVSSADAETIRNCVMTAFDALFTGDDVLPQKQILPLIYAKLDNVANVEIKMAKGSETPSTYTLNVVEIANRELAVTDEDKITVTGVAPGA